MSDTLYRVAVSKDGRTELQDYSEADYNSNVIPYLESNYNPDDYSVARLSSADEDNLDDNAQYLVTATNDGGTQEQIYDGADLKTKLGDIRNMFPGQYKVRSIEGAVRRQAAADNTPAEDDWQGRLKQQTSGMAEMTASQMGRIADMTNTPDLAEQLARQDALKDLADSTVANVYKQVETTDEEGNTAEEWQLRTAEELQAFQKARDEERTEKAELRDILAQLKEIDDIDKKDTERWNAIVMDENGDGEVSEEEINRFAWDSSKRHQRKAELSRRLNENKYYREEYDSRMALAEKVKKEAQPVIDAQLRISGPKALGEYNYNEDKDRATIEGRDTDALRAARFFANQTEKTLKAADDDTNGFIAFLQGGKATFSDADFWAFGLSSIVNNLKVKDAFDKIADKVQGAYSDETLKQYAEEGDFDKILSPDEVLMIQSFVNASQAQALRAYNTRGLYDSGKIAAESIGFMAQFLATGGIGKAASSGVTKFANWLTTKAISSAVARGAGKAAQLATKGAIRLGQAIAEPAVASIPMTLLQTGMYKGYAENLTARNDDGSLKYTYGTAILPAMRDAYKEVWSEQALTPLLGVAGKTINKTLGTAADATKVGKYLKTSVSKVTDALGNREALGILADAGFDGFLTEMGEEYLGALLESTWNKGALKDMLNWQEFGKMAAGFAPMSVLGAGASMTNYVSRVNKYNKAESYIRNLLQEEVDAGRMQQEDMDAMLNRKTSTLADIGNKVASIITPLVETRQFDEETFKALWDFAVATGEKEIAEACINRVQSDRRNAVANIINERMGGKNIVSVVDGERTVSYVDDNGTRRYVLTDRTDSEGKYLSYDENGENPRFIDAESYGRLTTMTEDQFYDSEYDALAKAGEQERMQTETEQNKQSLTDAIRAGESKLSLKDANGVQREYLFSGWQGDNAVVIPVDEQGNPVMDKATNQPVTETRSMQEVADALGMDVTVLTDAQIEQRKIDDMTAAESVVRMGNTQKGAAVEIDGVRGRLARFFARQNEDGTISYMANLVLRGKTTTIEVDKADIEALIEQRKMMTDPQKQDGKQIRKWERKDKLESDRAYSEAKARFTNPDGSVRQSAFLAEDPENFARYSDENYGKADTDATLKANQTAMAQALLQAQQALDAEADPDAKNTLRIAAEQAQARLNTINDLVARRNHDVSSDGALSEEEARQTFDGMLEMGLQEEEIQALANNNIAEAKQAIEAIPAPQITTDIQSYIKAKEEYNNLVGEQQKKIDYWNSILNAPTREYLDAMEAERNLRRQAYNLLTRIGNAQTTEAQEQLMKEYSALMIDHAIAQSSADPEVAGIAADIQSNLGQTDVPVNVVTIANVLDVVKAKGISRENYNDLLRMLSLQHGKSFLSGINTGTTGFTIGGEVYLIADNCRTIESAKTTYYHERQHLINKTDTGLVNAIIANFGKDRNALLEALGKIHSTLGYESLDARSLADEISAYVMEQVLTGQDYARMLSEAGFDNNFIKLFENEQQRQQQPGFRINRYGNGNALFRTDAEGDGTENVGDVQGAAEQESDGYLPRTDDESRADAVAQGSGGQLEISEDASSPIRFSTSAAIEGAGLKYIQQDENGDFAILFPDGRKMTGRDAIKGDDLKAIPNTVLGYMMADARAIGTITPEVEDMMWQRYADMLNAYLKSGLKENGGFENLIGKWQWLGETAYKTVASNSDKQYSFSMDITRVCKKNEAVINGIAELQKRQGYGATPAQIMDLYLESDALGYQVPCPVCYVFSRYINNGRYATVMINGQRKYGDRLADPSKLTEEERKEKIAMWVEELHKQEALNDQNASAITAAKKDIKYILEQIDDISKTLSMPGKRTKKQIDNLKKKAYALDVQYKAALDVVSQGSLDSWIKQFAIKENKDGEYEDPQTGKRYSLYDDTYQGFPEEVALDLRQTATAMREYPAIQRYRNTRGAGAGKEITFVANNDLGEVAMMLGSLNVPTVTDALRADTKDKIDLKYPPNYYKLAVNAKTEEQRNDYLAKARKRFLSAHLYAQQQSLRGGQRMWSWSDNIERLAPDVFLNMFQLRLAGGALQSYSKQLEGVKLVASLGGYVNGSLMGEGIGYREVSADEIETVDGKMYVKGEDLAVTDKDGNAKSLKAPVYEKDGKYYTLVFSKLIGIDAYGGNGKKGLFQLNQELDKAGNILVGMNDLHIEAAMADDRVFFIIPWHASGADSHILKQMLEYLRVNLDNWKPFDYTGVQEEKKYKADDELNKYLIEFWNNHNYESKFDCGIEGGIPSGKDGKLSPQQVHYRELRDAILRGKAVQDSEGKDKYVPVEHDEKWMKEIRNDIFLNQLYNKVRGSVDSEQMTSTDTGFIYPYEYWDTESNYWTADVNGERYLEYCRRLGFKPKFCGKLDGKAEDNGNFTDNKGFWKLLIDRRMYDTRGVYQDLTVVDMQDFNPDLVDPEQTAKEFEVTRVADEAGTQEIVDRVIERENNRLGGSARVNYGLTLDKAVSLYQTAKTKPSEYYSALAQTEGYVSEEEANEDRISYRTVTDQKLIDELNSGELIEVYRAMQVIDGKLYPPMSAYVDGVLREPSERGAWEESEEHPEQADENGNFLLEKGKSDDGKRKSLKAAYNPYYHTALNPINDQFSEAQNRSNMVIVKGLVPKSEIDNPYHAEKAKDSTGRVKWHKGPLAGILGQYEGKGREVILSRYFKPIDIVPESEIADVAASLFKDTTLEKNPLPSNVFTPALRAELEKKGFTFVETDNTGELIDKPGVTWASVYGKKGLGNAGLGERIAKGKKLTKDQIKALEFIGVKPEDVKVDNNGSLMFRTENANQSAFISNALASLDKIQMKSGNAQAWINKIQQAGGLKKEEDKWIGLTDWLKDQKGNISKDDVAEYIREHQIQIEEVKYGMSLPEDAFEFDYVEDIDNAYVSINDWEKAVALYNESNKDQIDVNDPSDENWEKVEAFGNSLLSNKIDPIRNKYTTGGLENKREIALTVPTIEPYKANDEVHFGDAGDGRAIAWARFGDDVDADGNKVLVIDEIQSKRHQEGKDKGYKGDKEYQEAKDRYDLAMADVDAYWKELTDKYGLEVNTNMTPDEKSLLDDKTSVGREAFLNLEEKSQKQKESVPDAPFRDSWDALAMKRMLRLAAEEGYDKIAWTSGQMQSDRYGMTKVLGDFYYKPNGDGTYKVSAALNQRRTGYTDYSDLNYDSLTVDKIGEIFGKEIATKVSEGKGRKGYSHNNEGEWITFSGRDLKMANEGMRYFYDQKLVNWMNKYGKKWGVQVTDLTLPNLENEEGWHSVDVTPEMRESVMQGQVMFRTTANYRSLDDIRNNPNGVNKLLREGKINRYNYNSAVKDLKLNPLLSYLNKNSVYLPYRKVFKTVSVNDYYIGTEATFEPVYVENELDAKWDELKKMEGFRFKKSPLSNSEYLVNEETGDIYRYSDHWGAVASCSWKLNGLDNKTTAIGEANVKDFKPIYGAGTEVVNPKTIEEYGPLLEQTIANYEGILRDESFDIDDVAREKLQSAIDGNKELLEWWKEESQKEDLQLRRPMFRTTEQREQLFADAKKEFGTTTDMREAGYLLPDGSMLDFSEKNNGGEPGRRGADHRDIARVINDRSYGTMTEYLDDFINEGAIRLIPESGAFSVAQQPTKEQKNMLRNFIYRYNGEVEVEIYKDGHSVANPYYRVRTSPQRVLNDIDAYFNDGTIPEGNAPMFRTDISPEVREEMDAIVAEAKANGTYLKAPNGADTKLTPEQWAMVRTKNFKNWFGDWESAAKLVDEDIQFKDLIGKTIIGYRYGKAPEGGRSFNTLTRSYESGVSMASVGYNAEVGSFAAMANEEEGKYYYIGEIAEETGGDDEICLNNVRELTKEEYESLLPQYTAISNAVANAYYNRSANVASKGYDIDLESAKAKRDAAIREIDSSKVVDENGEPRVVYHGTNWDPISAAPGKAVFDKNRVGENFAFVDIDWNFFFTGSETAAQGYGRAVPVFLNIRNMNKHVIHKEILYPLTEEIGHEIVVNAHDFGDEDDELTKVDNADGTMYTIRAVDIVKSEEAFSKAVKEWDEENKSKVEAKKEELDKKRDAILLDIEREYERLFNALKFPEILNEVINTFRTRNGMESVELSDYAIAKSYLNYTLDEMIKDAAEINGEDLSVLNRLQEEFREVDNERLNYSLLNIPGRPEYSQFKNLEAEYNYTKSDIFALDEPNQIKSATDNNGEFNPDDPDIRFRTDGDFKNKMTSDEVFDALAEISDYGYGGAINIIQALESNYGGELVSASELAGKAIKDGLVPFPGRKYEGEEGEYHHMAFDVNGEIKVEAVPFFTPEQIREKGVMFRTEYTPVVEIGRNGLSAFLEKKNSSLTDFIDDAWINYNSNKVDGSVAKQIADMMANGDTLNEAYLSVMADIAAKPIISEDEKAFATQSAEVLSAIAEEEISGNETLWAVYKEARKDKTGMFDRFADIKVGRNLGTEPGIDPKDSIVDYLTEAGKAEADVKTKHKALMALADALSDIRTAMRAQREYDRMTAQDMVTLSRLAIASGLLDDATRGEVKRLLGIVKRTIGMTKIRGRVDELYNLILDNCLRNVESYYKTAMKRKPVKVNKNGVVAQGALDIDGQRLMETYKDALDMPVDDDGSGRKTIADLMNEAFDRYNGEDETKAHEAEVDINALSLAKRYLTDVVASLAEEKDMKQSLESAKDALKKGQLTEEDYKQLIKETKACITTTKADRLKALSDITQNLLDYQKASRGAAAEFSARQKEHIAEIYRDAERDMEGRPFDENPQTPGLIQKIVGSQAAQLFLAPLATFDMVFKMVGNKNAAGEGYLYNRFVRGWIDCSGAEQTNTESAFSELDEKVSEVFGKKMRWSDLYSVVRGMPQVECFFIDGAEKKSHMLTQGNLMYILLADNMEDGRMKLRNMGISEEDVEAIRKQMDPRFLELGRWVVEEFLPSRREAYNEVHMRMFGAPMSSVDNYFPLHILKGARMENVDVASANREPVSPSTITGNIIKRTKNALALDVMGTDAFSAVIEHVQKMEHWRAFAEWNRDISTLLSNRKFRNRIVNMSSMYGYGEDLWKTFKDVCMVAAGSYSPKGVTKVDKSIMKIAKGVTAAKISLRVFTALKQFLSFPAYFSEANAEYLVKGVANPMKGWNWCMENLPLFRKRWLSRQAGDHILSTSEDWHSRLVENAARVGMSPNAFVDALTVSIGAYAIYQTKYRKYKDMGYSDEVADRRAKQDATISYNETQQSNENAFLSPMQMDRSYATAMLTVFRNSSMGYTRQVADAARNLKRRMDKGYREKSIAFMTEQLINDGLDPAKAPGAARRLYAMQGVKDVTRVAIFGYIMQFAWNLGAYGLYLLFGDDDDKKKEMLTDVAVHSLFGSIEGLSAGNVMSELGNMIAMGESLNNYDPTLMPLMSDAKNVISEFSRDNVAAINSIVNLVVQMGLGVNPQTIEDMVLAIIDAAKGDPVVAQEALILGMRLIEAPQSQIDQIYLDEIQLSAVDAQKMTIPELAERYARYKTGRGATLTGWLYTDADKDEVMNKHIQNFENKAKERLTADMANQRYVQLEEDAKALENRVTLLRQKAIQGDEQASAELNDIFLSEDYGRALRFQEQQKLINAKAKEAVEAPTVDEMLTALADIDKMKKQLYDDFAGEESPSYLKDQYVQYTKGILAQMAKLDKKYETEYIQRNPEYEKMMAQYQKDLDNAANEAKSNRERITELEEEKLKYRKPGKKTYFPRYKNRVKEINDSIKELRSRGTSAASIMSKVKKSLDVGEEAYMPSDILNSDEFRAYLAVKDLGSIAGNTFVFKEVADLEQKIKEAENPETKAKLAKRRDDLMGRMAQLVSRELNNVDDSDEVIE